MAYNPEGPQFWQPFSTPGVRTFRYSSNGPNVRSLTHTGTYIRALMGFDAREVVYPEYNEELPLHDLLGWHGFGITSHISELRRVHPDIVPEIPCDIETGESVHDQREYQHTFVWRDGNSVMTDVWSSRLDDAGYPTAVVRVFRGLDEVDPLSYGHAGGNTLVVLGEEEKYRRKLTKLGKTIEEFAFRSRTNMPDYPEGFIAYARRRRC